MMLALGVMTVWNGAFLANSHAAVQEGAFDRLVERPGMLAGSSASRGQQSYQVVGGNLRFSFSRDDRSGRIRFYCSGADRCSAGSGRAQTLSARRGSGGDTIFRSRGGDIVLVLSASGGITLYGGASFVPSSVPRSGQAVIAVR